MGRTSNRIRVLLLLDKADALSNRRIKKQLNISDQTYDRVRSELLGDGLIEKTPGRRGVIQLTPKGQDEILSIQVHATSKSGTGFFVSSNGHVLTNAHVIEDSDQIRVCLPNETLGEQSSLARVVAIDANSDLALLKTDLKPTALPAFRGGVGRLGEPIAVFGFPMPDVLARTGNVTEGIVSALAFGADTSRFQI